MAKKNDSLLREAIADAREVKETALANAKAALEEAFTPHLTSMLSARLRNEVDYGDEDLDELNNPVSGDAHGSEDGGRTDVDKVQQSSFTGNQNVTEEVDDRVDNDAAGLASSGIAQPETQKYGTASPRNPATAASAQSSPGNTDNEGLQQPAGTRVSEGIFEDDEFGDEEDPFGADDDDGQFGGGQDMGMEMGGEEEYGAEEDEFGEGDQFGAEDDGLDQDLDLEAIIAELEADMAGDDEMGGLGDEDEMGDLEDEPVMEQNDAEVSDGHGPGEGGEKDAAATQDSSFTQGEGDRQTGALSEMADDEEIDLEEILREIEDEEADDTLQVENRGLRSELKEYRDAIQYLRSKLNEVNLLNAKLLFTNKLFKSFNMDVRQKMRVVENFDRATTPREAKLVFTTLAEAFKGKPVSRKTRRTVTEGAASRAGGSTRPRGQQRPTNRIGQPTVLSEGADLAARFQKLAGIKVK